MNTAFCILALSEFPGHQSLTQNQIETATDTLIGAYFNVSMVMYECICTMRCSLLLG